MLCSGAEGSYPPVVDMASFLCYKWVQCCLLIFPMEALDFILNYVGVVLGRLPELWFPPLVSWKFWVFSYIHFGIWLCSYGGSIWTLEYSSFRWNLPWILWCWQIVSGSYSHTIYMALLQHRSIHHIDFKRKSTRPFCPGQSLYWPIIHLSLSSEQTQFFLSMGFLHN